MPNKLVEEASTTPDDGNEKDVADGATDCTKNVFAGEDDSDVEADEEWIAIPRPLFHPENKITAMEARDYNYSCKLGFKLNEEGKEGAHARIEQYGDKL
jgi:hypothetical protein